MPGARMQSVNDPIRDKVWVDAFLVALQMRGDNFANICTSQADAAVRAYDSRPKLTTETQEGKQP